MRIIRSIFCLFLLSTLSSCGGGGGSSEDSVNFITMNMSPLRVIGFSDDSISDPLYPLVDMGTIPDGKTVLLRVRDPYASGDYYSIEVDNGFGAASTGSPTAAAAEPDDMPMDATMLTFGSYSHHGLDPVLDEDWFSFTGSAGECCHWASTIKNLSGGNADPVLEVYDSTPNLGPITYQHNTSNPTDRISVRGVFDPANNSTLIGMVRSNAFDGLDKNSFFLVFSGPTVPGDYPILFAAPPIPDDSPNSVTGSIHIDQYDDVSGKITGTFNLTIVDVSRTSTVEGSFEVEREQDEAGLLTGFKPDSARAVSSKKQFGLKALTSFLKQN